MKIIVFSDSHGDVDSMVRIVEKIRPDMIIHLGDNIKDAVGLEKACPGPDIRIVKGNTDYQTAVPTEKAIDIQGRRIFFAHGHEYGVRNTTSAIYKKGRSVNADIVLFGHTHIPYLKTKNGITLMNPGKVGRAARGMREASFGLIKLDEGICCDILPVSNPESGNC